MSHKSKPNKPPPLQTWLRDIINLGKCPGVSWVDKSAGIFKILWMNQKSPSWREEYASIFVEYANLRNSEKQPVDKPALKTDIPTFKQNFKSALNKNAYVERLETTERNVRLYRLSDCKIQAKRPHNSSQEQSNVEQAVCQSLDNDRMNKDTFHKQELCNDDNGYSKYSGSNWNGFDLNSSGSHDSGSQSSDSHGSFCDNSKSCNPSEQNGVNVSPPKQFKSCTSSQVNIYQAVADRGTRMPQTEISQRFNLFTHEVRTELKSMIPSFLQNDLINNSPGGMRNISPGGMRNSFPGGMDGCVSTGNSNINIQTLGQADQLTFTDADIDPLPSIDPCTILPEIFNASSSSGDGESSLSSMDTSEGQHSLAGYEGTQSPTISSKNSSGSAVSQNMVDSNPQNVVASTSQNNGLMRVIVKYGKPDHIMRDDIIKSNQCKIFPGKVDNKRLQQQIDQKDNVEQIELPSLENLNFDEKNKSRIQEFLPGLKLGILIRYINNDIYVVRRCKSHVFLSDGISSSVKLPRSNITGVTDEEIKAFDFQAFTDSIRKHRENKNNLIGKYHFMLTVGCEIQANLPSVTRPVPIYIEVYHLLAEEQRLQELGGPKTLAPDPMQSLSDSFDNQITLSDKVIPGTSVKHMSNLI